MAQINIKLHLTISHTNQAGDRRDTGGRGEAGRTSPRFLGRQGSGQAEGGQRRLSLPFGGGRVRPGWEM